MPDSQSQRFVLLKIGSSDYPALTNISLLSLLCNPFYYLTHPPFVAHEHIVSYHQSTEIEFSTYEGKEIQTVKIVDISTPDKQITGFASWRMSPVPMTMEPMEPVRLLITISGS
jgi:hypothetical protein